MKRTALLCHKCAVNKRFRHPNTLPAWLQTALGRSLMEAEHECLRHMLAGLFGPVAVQISETGFYSFVRFSHAAFCYTASMDPARCRDDGPVNDGPVNDGPVNDGPVNDGPVNDGPVNDGPVSLYCIPEQLPFETKSVGLVILPHVLEFSDYPHQILREVERVLVPEGSLVVLGFNPLSIWGAVSLFKRGPAPWNGRFSTLGRIKDWLTLLNFELTAGRMVYHRPPVQSEGVRRRLDFLERAGDRWWPLGAAVYAVVARKREIGVTPLYPRWKRERRLSPGLAKPVARTRCASYDRFR